jgi:WD40 repeat protein
MYRRNTLPALALAVSLTIQAARLLLGAPLGATIAEAHPAQRPLTTPTQLPGLDPTPYGRPIAVGTPLPAPAPAAGAIVPANVPALVERARLDAPGSPGNAGEAVIGFTRDGARMVTHVDYTRLLVRRMPGGEIALASDDMDGGSFGAQLISPDGQVFATANQSVQGFVDLWDLGTGERLRQHRGGEQVRDMLFTPDGQRLVAARGNGQVQVWDVAGGSLLANYRATTNGEDAAIAADPVKGELATAGVGRVDLRARDTGEILRTLRSTALGSDPIGQLRYRPDGGALAAVATQPRGDWNSTEHRIVVWEGESQVGTLTFTGRRFVSDSSKWSPDGRSLLMKTSFGIADNQQAQVWLWDGRSTRVEIVAERNRSPRGVAWSPDSRLVAIGLAQTYSSDGQYPGETWLYDVAARSVLRRLPGVVEPWFSPDGAWLVVKGDGVTDQYLHLFAVDPSAPCCRVYIPYAGAPPRLLRRRDPHPPQHLLGADVLGVRRDEPYVAVGIPHAPGAIAPGHVGHRLQHDGAFIDGALERGVGVRHVEHRLEVGDRNRGRLAEHDQRVADAGLVCASGRGCAQAYSIGGAGDKWAQGKADRVALGPSSR